MYARLFRSKRQGQSIILIALIIVVLVAMVGLSVDVGNTYAENRSAVRATNAAALAGMDKLINHGSDADIGAVIVASFKSNGITAQIDPSAAPQSGERRILAYYLDSNGNKLGACTVGACASVPNNVAYIQVRTEGTVDTYFARVVGQQTLPVKAQAFAAQCTPVQGVYPIAINAADISTNGFLPPTASNEMAYYGKYVDSTYPDGRWQRRIYRKATMGLPGSFDWLQWDPSGSGGSATALDQMLTGDGNLDTGFTEVTPWPDPNSNPPAGYPLYPGQLSDGDWLRANTGNTNSTAVRAALDYHIANRTVLNLPIVDQVVGNGANGAAHFVRMGAFYLRGYSLTPANSSYFDLVYIGESDKTACLNTNVNQGLKGMGLAGQVYVNPRWQTTQPPSQPVAYQIVLDVSGSMSWNFTGYGTYDGTNNSGYYSSPTNIKGDVQCESPNNQGSTLPYTDRCVGGENSAWRVQNERRIYVAKNAILNFINRMGQYDMMRVISFSSSQAGNAAALSVWSSDKAVLRAAVMDAGKYSGSTDPYLTSGGTPGAQALYKASQMFKSSNGYKPVALNGADFKPVVVYLTDGVSNIFLNNDANAGDDSFNNARDICSNMSIPQAWNTATPCQIGYTSTNVARPITAMINVANDLKATLPKLEIYAVGLAQVPETGLPQVANERSYYFPATSANVVEDVLTKIQAQATGTTCSSGGGFQWVNFVAPANTPASPPAPGGGIYGYAYIYDVGSATPKYTLPIRHDTSTSNDGRLGFSIPPPDPSNPSATGITPGTYEMEAYMLYKGQDGVTRQYDYFINQSSLSEARRITFSVSSAAALGSTVPINPIFMDLQSTVRVCPTTP